MSNPIKAMSIEDRLAKISKSLDKRHKREKQLKVAGITAITLAIGFLVVLMTNQRMVSFEHPTPLFYFLG